MNKYSLALVVVVLLVLGVFGIGLFSGTTKDKTEQLTYQDQTQNTASVLQQTQTQQQALCQYQVLIGPYGEDPQRFMFVIPTAEKMITPAEIEGIVALKKSSVMAGYKYEVKKGPFDWVPGALGDWATFQRFSFLPDALIMERVTWSGDTNSIRYGCGIYQSGSTNLKLASSPYSRIDISIDKKNPLRITFSAPKTLFDKSYSRVEAIYAWPNELTSEKFIWGPFKWSTSILSDKARYTHTFGGELKGVIMGIFEWSAPDSEGITRIRFGYGGRLK
jgi:hypothetical protein